MAEILDNMTKEEQAKIAPLSSTVWLTEIEVAVKNLEKWHEQARRIVRRFLDKRDEESEATNKLNLFTTNTNILIATLYAKFPKPMVTREFEDQDDDVARVAATMMERMLKIQPRDDVDSGMRSVVQDRLVPGLGQLWLRYDPEIESGTTPAVTDPATGAEVTPAEPFERIVDERVCVDYVFWEDFIYSPARTWEQVRWVARRVKMNKQDATKRFGEKIVEKMTFAKAKAKATGVDEPDNNQLLEATVYEIWCKRTKKVYWVSPGFELQLDQKPDPLRVKNFWPCPKPTTALTSTSNFVPRPDYLMAQDQYEELDTVNNRITWIERAIKVVGVYDGAEDEISRIFKEGIDNRIIPSRNFAAFAERGGFKGAIDWLPIEALVNALDKLRTYRQDLISQIYELTGISDIMRGSSKASETLGAQQLKAQYGSVKLQFLQMDIAGFVEEVLDIKAEIIRNLFQPETIVRYSNIGLSNDVSLIEPAIQLIKSGDFDMRVQVHADSMAVPEFNAERDGRMGFIRAISEMMTAAAPILEKSPGAGVAMLKVIQWAAGSFRTGYTIESVLDKAIKEVEKTAMTPPPPPPPPPPVPVDQTKVALEKEKQQGEDRRAKLASDTSIFIKRLELGAVDKNAQMDRQHEASLKTMDQGHDAESQQMDLFQNQRSEALDRFHEIEQSQEESRLRELELQQAQGQHEDQMDQSAAELKAKPAKE